MSAGSWSYAGDTGPDHWADIAPTCGGNRQSPVDLAESALEQDMSLPRFVKTNFDKTTGINWVLLNNGHTTQVNYGYDAPENEVKVSGGGLSGPSYTVAQFHFHWGSDDMKGSEHTVDRKMYPMEVHVVTYNNKYANLSQAVAHADGLAVLGFFFEIANDNNPRIQALVDHFPDILTGAAQKQIATAFSLEDFVAGMTDFYRYSGSLTTPSCNEIVTWTVFTDTIKVSSAQMAEFRKLKDTENHSIVDNYRPVQNLNGRTIKTTFVVAGGSSPLVFSTTAILLSLLASVFSRL
nr:hypothetical protein BaRGS_015252 [Batillaria attramentaria]